MPRVWTGLMLGGLLALAAPVGAQVVTAPTVAHFQHPDADYGITATYRVEFFQCSALSAGICQGRAAQPFQAGTEVPRASVTGPATDRVVSLTAAPVSGDLTALPVGVPFVATVVAVGDATAGGIGESGRSTDSNPFFARGRTPAAPSQTRVQ